VPPTTHGATPQGKPDGAPRTHGHVTTPQATPDATPQTTPTVMGVQPLFSPNRCPMCTCRSLPTVPVHRAATTPCCHSVAGAVCTCHLAACEPRLPVEMQAYVPETVQLQPGDEHKLPCGTVLTLLASSNAGCKLQLLTPVTPVTPTTKGCVNPATAPTKQVSRKETPVCRCAGTRKHPRGTPCAMFTTKTDRNGNQGRRFYACSRGKCRAFWFIDPVDGSKSFDAGSVLDDVYCYCGTPVNVQAAFTNQNAGRRFISCRNVPSCDFWQWYNADSEDAEGSHLQLPEWATSALPE
jgi:ssDNA-binding Zn-finger/Zn-ribbon topoisomerase 1